MRINSKFGDIIVERNSLRYIHDYLKKINPHKIAVIVDKKVSNLWLDELLKDCTSNLLIIEIGDENSETSEKYKNLDFTAEIWKKLIDEGFTRKSLLIGFGGGVTTDLTGFVASTFMRGIPYINIPTTLMGQVDASIGGKTGIDFNGKNLIGTFHQPEAIIIDPRTLETLSEIQIKNGLAEIIKYGIISDLELWKILKNSDDIIDKNILMNIIERSVECKIDIVKKDEKESDIRMFLNFGHTVGHAVELLSNYEKPHGYCVSIGMAVASKIGEEILSFENTSEIKTLLEKFGLPTTHNHNPEDIISAMKNDKKFWRGNITMVLPKKIGEVVIKENISQEALKKALEETRDG